MAYRRFIDGEGREWEVVVRSKREWIFEPVGENPGPRCTLEPPSYERDPFEFSKEELQHMLDDGPEGRQRDVKSPFKD